MWQSPGTTLENAVQYDRLCQEIATSAYGLLAMTRLSVDSPQNTHKRSFAKNKPHLAVRLGITGFAEPCLLSAS